MEIGTVIIGREGNKQVVIEKENGKVARTESLDDHLSKSIVINHDGEYKTLKEILDCHVDEYLSKNKVIYTK